jgi:transposase
MLLEKSGIKIFVFKETIDMRAGFERLHGYCVEHMAAKMNEGHAYVFFGKNRSRLKLLVYDGTGLVLVAKKIERKSFMSHEELLGRTEITMDELRLIFHGSVLRRPVFGEEADHLDQEQFRDFLAANEIVQKNHSTQWEGFALPKGNMNAQC